MLMSRSIATRTSENLAVQSNSGIRGVLELCEVLNVSAPVVPFKRLAHSVKPFVTDQLLYIYREEC